MPMTQATKDALKYYLAHSGPGAAVGAAGGALADREHRGRGALVGGLVGGAAGAGVGKARSYRALSHLPNKIGKQGQTYKELQDAIQGATKAQEALPSLGRAIGYGSAAGLAGLGAGAAMNKNAAFDAGVEVGMEKSASGVGEFILKHPRTAAGLGGGLVGGVPGAAIGAAGGAAGAEEGKRGRAALRGALYGGLAGGGLGAGVAAGGTHLGIRKVEKLMADPKAQELALKIMRGMQ